MDTLATLLDEGVHFDAEFGGSLSSHRPMALAALARLGAGPDRLRQWATRYEQQRLHAAPPPEPWPAGDPWPPRLGDVHAWPAYRGFFADWLEQEGVADVLTPVLPQLMQGCGCAAFHGLIRVAYAVHSARRAELADALAYWACRWWPVPMQQAVDAAADTDDVGALLAVLRPQTGGHRLIALAMADAASQRGFAATVSRLVIDERSLPTLARRTADDYARSGNFVALHLLTSAHAVRVLLPFLDGPRQQHEAVAAYWRAFACGHAAACLKLGRLPRALPWPQIVERAIAQDDDHVIKLVDSCREQQAAYGGDAWQLAATRAVAAAP